MENKNKAIQIGFKKCSGCGSLVSDQIIDECPLCHRKFNVLVKNDDIVYPRDLLTEQQELEKEEEEE